MQSELALSVDDVRQQAADGMTRQSGSNSNSPRKDKDNEKRKHRRKRGRRHKWKPYDKMSWEEKAELEERDRKRAERKQAELWRQGKPTAPCNTNEFLMEDHGRVGTPAALSSGRMRAERVVSLDSSFSQSDDNDVIGDVMYESTSDDEVEFRKAGEREFDEMYEQAHTEKLQGMSREALISECLLLERRLNEANEANEAMKKPGVLTRSYSCSDVGHETFVQEPLVIEVERLRRENRELKKTAQMTMKNEFPS